MMMKHWKWTLAVLLTASVVALFAADLSMGAKGGGGKPPKDDPPTPPDADGAIYWRYWSTTNDPELWRMDADGSNKTLVRPSPEAFGVVEGRGGELSSLLYGNQRWGVGVQSFDGVAFEVYASQLVTLPDESTWLEFVQLTDVSGEDGIDLRIVRWANDGADSCIVFSGWKEGQVHVWQLNVSGSDIDTFDDTSGETFPVARESNLTLLLSSDDGVRSMAPSPTLDRIAYGKTSGGLWVYDVTAQTEIQVFADGWFGADWSPDGWTIAVSDYNSIWTVPVLADGTFGAPIELVPGPVQRKRKRVGWYTVDFHHPRFSPDGLDIVFTEYRYLDMIMGNDEKGINRISVVGGAVYDLTGDVDATRVGLANAWR